MEIVEKVLPGRVSWRSLPFEDQSRFWFLQVVELCLEFHLLGLQRDKMMQGAFSFRIVPSSKLLCGWLGIRLTVVGFHSPSRQIAYSARYDDSDLLTGVVSCLELAT